MKESANNKTHTSSNFLFSICLLIMLDALLLGPSLNCKQTETNCCWGRIPQLKITLTAILRTPRQPSSIAEPSALQYSWDELCCVCLCPGNCLPQRIVIRVENKINQTSQPHFRERTLCYVIIYVRQILLYLIATCKWRWDQLDAANSDLFVIN
jgi:hypothetical protein